MKRFSARVALIAALAIIALSVVAYAAATNPTIIELYTKWFGSNDTVEMLKEQTVQKPALTYELDDITIAVTEVIFDGNTLYTTGVVAPKAGSNVVIMSDMVNPSLPAGFDVFRGDAAPEGAPTYAELAAEKGAKLLHTHVWVEAEGGDGSYMNDSVPLTDGTYSFINEFPDAHVADGNISGIIGALQYEVTEDGIEIEGTRVRNEWSFTVGAVAKELRTPEPKPVATAIPQEYQENALIVVDSEYAPQAEAYVQAFPDQPVIFKDGFYDDIGMNYTTKAILEGKEEWDVMNLSTVWTDLPLLMESGALADLAASDTLADAVARMHPAIQSAVGVDGKVYALPTYMNCQYDAHYRCGEHAWAEMNFTDADIPQTLEGLYQFIEKWAALPAAERAGVNLGLANLDGNPGLYRRWLLEMLMAQYGAYMDYADQPLAFDTPLFKTLLARVETVSALLKAAEKGAPGYSLVDQGPYSMAQMRRIMPLRVSEESPYIAASSLTVYVINPNSKHMDAAIAYVETALGAVEPEQRALLYADVTREDLPSDSYQAEIEFWQGQLAQETKKEEQERAQYMLDKFTAYEERRPAYVVEAEDLAYYQQHIAPHLFFPSQSVFDAGGDTWLALDKLKKQYLGDTIDADGLIKGLDALVQGK